MVFDKSYYYENLNELKRPIATYVRNFRQLYPLVVVSSRSHSCFSHLLSNYLRIVVVFYS